MVETLAGDAAFEAPTPATPASSVRFACIEGLRAVAALAVFFIHVSETRYSAGFGYHAVGLDRYVRAFFDEFQVGVPIFFAISGFVMYRPFVARHVGGQSEPSTMSYITRRVLRIYPAYWARSWARCSSSATRSQSAGRPTGSRTSGSSSTTCPGRQATESCSRG